MHQFDSVCIGSAKIDIFLSVPKDSPYVHLDKKTNNLSVTYGQKIPVKECSLMLGGNACNVSVGLSKLKIKTAIMAKVGKDEFSQKIINTLMSENVNSDFLIRSPDSPSSFSVILSYEKDRTIFGEHFARKHDFSFENLSTKSIYLTSLGETWKNAYEKTLEFVKKTNTPLFFNPGSLQMKSGYAGIKEVLISTDILFLNKEEAQQILNINSAMQNQASTMQELLNSLRELGPKTAIITDGKNGSFAQNKKGEFFSEPIAPALVIEKTGAGDAYASGFLAAILSNLPLQTAMKWGTLNAASTMSAIGAQNGLLSRVKIEEKANE